MELQKGDKIEVTIISKGRKGDGLAKHKGFVIMIPNTEIGRRYEIRITDVYDKFGFGIKE